MKLTAVAQSYMNHARPQSSKSITIVRSPSTSRFAMRRSAWVRPKRSGPEPKRSSRSRIVAIEPRQDRERVGRHPEPVLPAPPVAVRAERGRVVPREARERPRPRPAREWACMRAETPPRRRNDGTSSAVGAAPSTHSNRTTLRGTARPSSDTACTRAPSRVRATGGVSMTPSALSASSQVSSDSISPASW